MFLMPFSHQKNKKKAFFFSNFCLPKRKTPFQVLFYGCFSTTPPYCVLCKKRKLRFQKTVVMIPYFRLLSTIFSQVFCKKSQKIFRCGFTFLFHARTRDFYLQKGALFAPNTGMQPSRERVRAPYCALPSLVVDKISQKIARIEYLRY